MAKKQKKLPDRTTLSLSAELGERLRTVAEASGVSVIDAVRAAVQQYVELEGVKESSSQAAAIRQARKVLDLNKRLLNPYQSMVAAWRLRRTEEQIDDIASARIELEAWPAEIYLMRILTELLEKLTDRDEFLTTTNLPFWDGADSPSMSFFGSETAGHYLATQEEAIARGMRLHRVFILRDDEAESRRLRQHQEFLYRSTEEISRSRPSGYRIFTRDQIEDARFHIGHFACIRRISETSDARSGEPDGGALIVEPVYDVRQRISHLRLLFSRGSSRDDARVKFYVDRFCQAAQCATSIESLTNTGEPPPLEAVSAR